MKRLMFVVCLLTFVVASYVSAQQIFVYEDVVYLKDGSVVQGIIIEHNIGESLKIQTQGGSVAILKAADVLNRTKLPVMIYKEKNPSLAFAFSCLVPGGGQAYNGQGYHAGLHWVVTIVCVALVIDGYRMKKEYENMRDGNLRFDDLSSSNKIQAGGLIGLGNWIVSMIAAPISAHYINKRNRENQEISRIRDHLLLEPHLSHHGQGAVLSLRF